MRRATDHPKLLADVEEHGNPLAEFDYSNISFSNGCHDEQLEQTHAVLMGLDDDSLLRPFRARAGFEAPGEELGGWYASKGPVPGHSFGQWLSALSRYHAIRSDNATKDKVNRLVAGFAATIEPTGKFYEGYEHSAYTFDLLAGGLIDAYRFAGVKDALAILADATVAAVPHLGGEAREMRLDIRGSPDEHLADHNYVLPEHQFIAWQLSGDRRHLELARQYLLDEFFDPLAQGSNSLPGRHAYTHVNALASAAKAYLVTGDTKYLEAARTGYDFIEAQSFATGGFGPHEYFVPTPAHPLHKIIELHSLGQSLTSTKRSFETPCSSYAFFKLARYLLRITKDPKYGDGVERLMYNTVLGAKPLRSDGSAFYYSDYSGGAHKEYCTDPAGAFVKWPCCAGSLPQVAADYRLCTYLRDESGVYVNLYIPSTLRWRHAGGEMAITQSGNYPQSDSVRLTIETRAAVRLAIRLRIPAWTTDPFIQVNGTPFAGDIIPGTFASIERVWSSGDELEIRLPRELRLKSVDGGRPDVVALIFEPLVLFAIGEDVLSMSREQLLSAMPAEPDGCEWFVDVGRRRQRFKTWCEIENDPYTTYVSVPPE